MNIDLLKRKVKSYIGNSEYVVTPNTKYNKVSGIYMLYVNHFTNDFIIPVYIGQTVDLQRRYQDHIKEIIALNRLSSNFYNAYLNDLFYDGRYKSCKIFKYMVDNGCDLSDLNMILLEECDESVLSQVEANYIKTFKSEFVGFNQLSSVTLQNASRFDQTPEVEKISRKIIELEEIKKYIEYGYTQFNFLYCYGIANHEMTNKEIIIRKDEISENLFKHIDKKVATSIRQSHVEQDKYLYRRRAEKIIAVNHFLVPEMNYKEFPLKSINNKVVLPNLKKHEKQLYFIISNTNKSYNDFSYYAEVLKIIVNSSEEYKEYFISNNAIDETYYERDYKREFCFRPARFTPVHASYTQKLITLTTEYKTGLNDYTFKSQDTWSLKNAISDIIKNSSESTKFRILSNQSRNVLEECLEELPYIKRGVLNNELNPSVQFFELKLLIINSTIFNARYHKSVMAEEGIIITRTRSFSKGHELLQKHKYDCVIFSVENNPETINNQINEVREYNKFVPIVVYNSKSKYEFDQDSNLVIIKTSYGEIDALFKSLIQLKLYSIGEL